MPTVYTEVEVDVDLDSFDDADIIDEMERRGLGSNVSFPSAKELVFKIYEKRRLGRQDYQEELDQLIYQVTGRVI
jgi:hypothetical protein